MRHLIKILCALSIAVSMVAEAQTPAPVPESSAISHAVNVYISPRGQQFFRDHLSDLLFDLGYSFDEGNFSSLSFQSDGTSLDSLPPQYANFKAEFTSIRKNIQDWFTGLVINDPQFKADIQGVSYKANFSKLSLVVDQKTYNTLGKTTGAILALEAEIKGLQVDVKQVALEDLQNPNFGQAQMNNFRAKMKSTSAPLRIRIPFYVDITPAGLKVEALAAASSAKTVSLAAGYVKPLVLPKFQIKFGSETGSLSTAKVDQYLDARGGVLVQLVQNYIDEMVNTTLPGFINSNVTKYVNEYAQEVNWMDPPGQDNVTPDARYRWGVTMKSIVQNSNYLAIKMGAYIDDPEKTTTALAKEALSQGPVSLALDSKNYDMAFSLSQGLINRVLQLNFGRQYFKNMPLGSGTVISLTTMPTMDLKGMKPGIPANRGRLRVTIDQVTTGIQKLFVSKNLIVSFDLYVDINKSADGTKFNVTLADIDPNSIVVPKGDINVLGKLIDAQKSVKAKVMAMVPGWQKTPSYLAQNIAIPSFMGIQATINSFQMDPMGHIIVYLNYGVKK